MKRKYLLLLALLTASVAPLHAQLLGFSHSVSLVGLVPTGPFSKSVTMQDPANPIFNRDDVGRDASLGVGVTYRLGKRFDVVVGDLTPFVEAGFFWNGIGSDNRDLFDDQRSADPTYRNIPLMVGVQYRHNLLPLIKPYVELALGYDIFMGFKEGWSNPSLGRPYYVFQSSGTSAWQLGVGTYIASKVSVGLTYYDLGKHAFDFKESSTKVVNDPNFASAANHTKAQYQRIGAMALKVSFHF